MATTHDLDVERCDGGWSVSNRGKRLKRFRDTDSGGALQRACHWAWEQAGDRGGRAWLKHAERRSRIDFGDDIADEDGSPE